MNLIDIMTPLAQPFAPQDIDFLPKNQFEKNGQTMCIGLPFADPRAYQDRLNEICPGEWSSQASVIVAGAKLVSVVTVTICGVPHTDVGEAPLSGENAATESFAQGFKRACAQTGLGRFLYALEKQYLPYDKTKKRFALNDQEMLAAVKSMYRKAGLLSSAPSSPSPASHASRVTGDPAPERTHTLAEIFKVGCQNGAWVPGTFYTTAEAILGVPVAKDTALAPEQSRLLMEAAMRGPAEQSA